MRSPTHDPFFFVEPSDIQGSRVGLKEVDAAHLARVRRARPGDRIHVSDGMGRVWLVELTTASATETEGEVIEETFIEKPKPNLAVLQGLAKGTKIDFVVQKLVEMGIDALGVFVSERSVPEWNEDRRSKANARWQMIGREAAKQSRRAWLPRISGPLDLEGAAKSSSSYELSLLADAGSSAALKESLKGAHPDSVVGIVGPEGGLTPSETLAFEKAGAKPVKLGDNVLRTETAAVVLISALMYQFDWL